MHTFAVSQYGERLLNRNSPYVYGNVTAFLVKKADGESSTKNCTLAGHSYSRQDRDTYIEVKDLEAGTYFMYVDVDWQPLTHQELPKNKLQYSLNCYGAGDVKFGKNTAAKVSQNETLDHIMTAYSNHHIDNETGDVKVDADTYKDQGITVYSETSVWKTGYRFKLLVPNDPASAQAFIYLHSHLDFKNGLIIQDQKPKTDTHIVGRCQVALLVREEPRGFYTKVYKGYGEGSQALTDYQHDAASTGKDTLKTYYAQHYERFELANYSIQNIVEDAHDDSKLPHDGESVEKEDRRQTVKSKRMSTKVRKVEEVKEEQEAVVEETPADKKKREAAEKKEAKDKAAAEKKAEKEKAAAEKAAKKS